LLPIAAVLYGSTGGVIIRLRSRLGCLPSDAGREWGSKSNTHTGCSRQRRIQSTEAVDKAGITLRRATKYDWHFNFLLICLKNRQRRGLHMVEENG
jgi:hypothetical protein